MDSMSIVDTRSLALLALAWPFVVAWLVFKLFPATLTKFLGKEIDRRSDAKLERLKAELQGSYSTLKTSVDVLAANNSDMRPHIIDAVSALWVNLLDMRTKFGGIVAFDSITLAEEAKEAFSKGKHENILNYVRSFEGDISSNELFVSYENENLDRFRLFCGDRVWLIFYIYRAVIMRNAFLISLSFKDKSYNDWRKDDGIRQLLSSLLPENDLQKIRQSSFGGLANALSRLETDFLHEAARVMSGSKAMAESLSDMQAMMLLQNAKIAQEGKQP